MLYRREPSDVDPAFPEAVRACDDPEFTTFLASLVSDLSDDSLEIAQQDQQKVPVRTVLAGSLEPQPRALLTTIMKFDSRVENVLLRRAVVCPRDPELGGTHVRSRHLLCPRLQN